MVHGDLKPRNVLRIGESDWVLCDLDATVHVGQPVGVKSSSGYAPPELARVKCNRERQLQKSACSFDIWSLGMILFELCAGQTLFRLDINNDEILLEEDNSRLCVWQTITDAELSPILQVGAGVDEADAARNLIRWCLMGDSRKRPSTGQVLQHPFINPGTLMPELRMHYHFFLSHAQADASGTASTLHLQLHKLFGVHCWLDMHQDHITLQGMRQGVHDSSVFILILTDRVLGRWFCQQEIMEAIAAGKTIQLVVEEEPRFHPFNRSQWEADAMLRQVDDQSARKYVSADGCEVEIPPAIAQMVDNHLPEALTFRRRDYEAYAMLRKLCTRHFIVPPASRQNKTRVTRVTRVFVICNENATAILTELNEELDDAIVLTRDADDAPNSDRVLVLLLPGIMEGRSLQLWLEMMAVDERASTEKHKQDRFVLMYSAPSGWDFDVVQSAPSQVQECVREHDAIPYRPSNGGSTHHEFTAMAEELAKKLQGGNSGALVQSMNKRTPAIEFTASRKKPRVVGGANSSTSEPARDPEAAMSTSLDSDGDL